MYNITLPILGQRLSQIREYLGYSQRQIAQELKCHQNAISNLERGKGGSLILFINLLRFYSQYIYIDLIFGDKFFLISNSNNGAAKDNLSSIIEKIIIDAKQKLYNNIDTAEKEFNSDLDKAIDLLKS